MGCGFDLKKMGEDRYAQNVEPTVGEYQWQAFFKKYNFPFRYIKGSLYIGDREIVFHHPQKGIFFVNGNKGIPDMDCFTFIDFNSLKMDSEETIKKLTQYV